MPNVKTWLATVLASSAMFVSADQTTAEPLVWPTEDTAETEVAFHCATVMTALARAYNLAGDLLELEARPPVENLPQHLLALAGGLDRLTDIEAAANDWSDHSESMARTSFYPKMAKEGTPYLADDGRVLMMAVTRCADRFKL